ncbi:MAG TPA: LCP family protein [Streptosporangiaceae bacterium]|jgi:LCP family protein required for cell wall assembly|nr:LCP family protein [Streptosporangiaceae bacterium]
MEKWPEGWTRGGQERPPQPRTSVLPPAQADPRYPPYADPYDDPYADPYADRPYDDRRAAPPRRGRVRRRRRWGRRLLIVALVLVALLVVGYLYLDSRLQRVNALGDYEGRPGDTPGTNWLIVGSDSRAGLSKAQRRKLRTGSAAGRRTDSMMLLHMGAGGTTLVSLPRDSFVPIPGHGSNKLNAAYAFGGPRLLLRTVEGATGVHIDHYAEIGFAGFVGMVDAVGGVNMCIKQPVRDPQAGLDLKAGCQELDGGEALGYVRSRKAFAEGDLARVQHQRQVLAALVAKATSPGTLFNPFRIWPLALRATEHFAVDERDHLHNLIGFAWGMRGVTKGDAVTTTVPIAGFGSSPAAGSYVRWDSNKAGRLFDAIKEDEPVPRSVVTKG